MPDSNLCIALTALADDHLILGHRLSEWCGHAPTLEEDLSLPNMALDVLGTAQNLYQHIARLEQRGRSEDDIAYLRSDREYLNCLLVEQPDVDFAHAMLKQFYFAAFMHPYWDACQSSCDALVRGVAAKSVKELGYHLRHSGEWIIRLGDGTPTSASRMSRAVDTLAPYCAELFDASDALQHCIDNNLLANPESARAQWQRTIDHVFSEAHLSPPDNDFAIRGGRNGIHGEKFGHLLSELQYMQRSYPGLQW